MVSKNCLLYYYYNLILKIIMRVIINIAIANYIKQFYVQSTQQLYTIFKNHKIMEAYGNYIIQIKLMSNLQKQNNKQKWYLIDAFNKLQELLQKKCDEDQLYECWICVMDDPKLQINLCRNKIIQFHSQIQEYQRIANPSESDILYQDDFDKKQETLKNMQLKQDKEEYVWNLPLENKLESFKRENKHFQRQNRIEGSRNLFSFSKNEFNTYEAILQLKRTTDKAKSVNILKKLIKITNSSRNVKENLNDPKAVKLSPKSPRKNNFLKEQKRILPPIRIKSRQSIQLISQH